jgi:Uma2 family endonuclease
LTRITAAEYLAWEREQPDKHEYDRGEVFAMAGASPRHNFLSAAVLGELRTATRGLGCSALTSDQRTALIPGERYVYPDAVIVCGEMRTEAGADDVLTNSRMVVEVLSNSTERYDRGEKWEGYQRLLSLSDYLLVSQRAVGIEHFRREEQGAWVYRTFGPGETIRLSNGAEITVDAIYDGAFALKGDVEEN